MAASRDFIIVRSSFFAALSAAILTLSASDFGIWALLLAINRPSFLIRIYGKSAVKMGNQGTFRWWSSRDGLLTYEVDEFQVIMLT